MARDLRLHKSGKPFIGNLFSLTSTPAAQLSRFTGAKNPTFAKREPATFASGASGG